MMQLGMDAGGRIKLPALTGLEYRSKGTGLRGTIGVLQRRGILKAVVALCSPGTVALVRDPPMAGGWVPGIHTIELALAIQSVAGREGAREIAQESARDSASTVLRPLIEGFLHLFGATPATLFSRLDTIAGRTSHGISFRYEEITSRSGTVVMTVIGSPDVPEALFWSMGSSLLHGFELCKVKGSMSPVSVSAVGRNTEGRVTFQW